MSDAPIPEGWYLTSESWSFHRQFHARVGRPMANGEFTAITLQIRSHAAPRLDRYHYQATLADGAPLIVRGGWKRLNGVEPAGWTPKAPKVAALKSMPQPPPVPGPQAPDIARTPPRQLLRASTLTLGNPGAARVLAERLRRFGLPEHAISQPAPP